MSSFTHELLVMLFGNTPHMLRAFLGKHLVASATRIRFRRSNATVSQVPPLGCDLCIELYRGRATKPFLVLVVEVQLGLNRKKPFSWFAYQACQHYRTRAPALLVVITNDRKVARWAAGPFRSGQTTLRPIVLGPDDIPAITDVEDAKRSIPLAFVSGIVHGRDRTAVRIGLALVHALADSDDDGLGIYWDAFLASLSKAVRKELEMEVRVLVSENWRPRSDWGKKIYAEGEAKGRAEGKAEGSAEGEAKGETKGVARAILAVLDARELPVTPDLRKRVTVCNDLPLLERWLRRASTAGSVEEAFAL
jgi:hypothetical protein